MYLFGEDDFNPVVCTFPKEGPECRPKPGIAGHHSFLEDLMCDLNMINTKAESSTKLTLETTVDKSRLTAYHAVNHNVEHDWL